MRALKAAESFVQAGRYLSEISADFSGAVLVLLYGCINFQHFSCMAHSTRLSSIRQGFLEARAAAPLTPRATLRLPIPVDWR